MPAWEALAQNTCGQPQCFLRYSSPRVAPRGVECSHPRLGNIGASLESLLKIRWFELPWALSPRRVKRGKGAAWALVGLAPSFTCQGDGGSKTRNLGNRQARKIGLSFPEIDPISRILFRGSHPGPGLSEHCVQKESRANLDECAARRLPGLSFPTHRPSRLLSPVPARARHALRVAAQVTAERKIAGPVPRSLLCLYLATLA